MTKKEAFKVGFAEYMAAHGIAPESLDVLLTKRAAEGAAAVKAVAAPKAGPSAFGAAGKAVSTGLSGLGHIGSGLVDLGLGLGKATLAVPLTLGALGGYLSTGMNPVTKEDMQAMETTGLMNEYRDAIHKIKPAKKDKPVVRAPITAEEKTPEYQVGAAKMAEWAKLSGVVDNINKAKAKVQGAPLPATPPAVPIRPVSPPALNAGGQQAGVVPAPKPVKL